MNSKSVIHDPCRDNEGNREEESNDGAEVIAPNDASTLVRSRLTVDTHRCLYSPYP